MEVSRNLQLPLQDGNLSDCSPITKEEYDDTSNEIVDDEGWMEVRNKRYDRPLSNKMNHNHTDSGGYYNERPKKHQRGHHVHGGADKGDSKTKEDVNNHTPDSADSPCDPSIPCDGDSDEKNSGEESDKKNKIEFVAAPIPKKNAWGASGKQIMDTKIETAAFNGPSEPSAKPQIEPVQKQTVVSDSKPVVQMKEESSQDWSELVKEDESSIASPDANTGKPLVKFLSDHCGPGQKSGLLQFNCRI